MADEIITLDVGGKIFKSFKSTLCFPKEGLLSTLIENKTVGEILFLDRDPQYFEIVLTYLRTKKIFIPPNLSQELVDMEFDFFAIFQSFDDRYIKNWQKIQAKIKSEKEMEPYVKDLESVSLFLIDEFKKGNLCNIKFATYDDAGEDFLQRINNEYYVHFNCQLKYESWALKKYMKERKNLTVNAESERVQYSRGADCYSCYTWRVKWVG